MNEATWFERQFRAVRARRVPVFLLLACLLAAAIAGIGRLKFGNSIEVMLPDGKPRDAIRFLTEASLADKVVVSLEKTDPDLPQEEFVRAADQLADRLRSPELVPVDTTAATTGMLENFTGLLGFAPQLFQAGDLAAAEAAVTPEAIDRSVRDLYQDLTKPVSLFAGSLGRHDPLGITRSVLGRLERLSAANLYDVDLEDGHLFSRDRRHLLLVFTTPVPLTDSPGSSALVGRLDAECAALPAGVRADVVCAHLHTASNERILKRDIERTSWTGAIAFLLIFAVVFRDWRSVAMLGIPVCTAFLALPLAALWHSQISYIVVGFGMVIVGISSDYGIYVYVMTRRCGEPARAVRRIVRPMGLGMLTTLAVFVAFYFSGIEGYRQLATFAIISIVLAYLAAVFLLPHIFGDKHAEESGTGFPACEPVQPQAGKPMSHFRAAEVRYGSGITHPILRALTAAAALAIGIAMISRGHFNTDITQLDGTDRTVLESEKRFEKTWNAGGNEQGILAVTAPTYEEALRRSETVCDRASEPLGGRLLSFSTLWRSESSRAANLARWREFWTPDRVASVQAQLLESGRRYGFTAAAFQPFFDQLHESPVLREPSDNALFKLIKDRFVRQSADGFTVFSFFPDTPEFTAGISRLAETAPGAFCVSRHLLTDSMADSIGRTLLLVTVISLALVLGLTLLLSPNWRIALIALVPAGVAVLWALGVPAMLQQTINLCHVTAAAVVFGLCVDYGIYMTHGLANGIERRSSTTVILTTSTSIIGAGVLLFTNHPVLFAIGLTLTTGMLVGLILAVWAVPGLFALWGSPPSMDVRACQAANLCQLGSVNNAENIMPESTETKIAARKLESSTEHAKKALDAATEATKAVGQTVKQHAQVAYEVGKEHITAAAKDLGDAASATYEDVRGLAKTKADEYQDKAKAAWGDATSKAQTYQSETEEYIRQNPLKAVGIAVGVGFLLGVIFRR
jgi:predicted exporter/ElaB/YqjD/DUF883 family membrane-anchored ribosome-binding protein